MKVSFLALVIGTGLLVGCGESSVGQDPVKAVVEETEVTEVGFERVSRAFSRRVMAERPEMATYYGFTDEDAGDALAAQLSYFDPASDAARRATLEVILADMKVTDLSRFTERQATAIEMIAYNLEGSLAPARTVDYGIVLGDYGSWFLPYPVTHISGAHVEVRSVLEEKASVKTADEAKAFVARLEAFPAVIAGLQEKLIYDKEAGVIAPDFIIDKTLVGLKNQLALSPADHSLVAAFKAKIEASNITDQADYIAAVEKAVAEHYYPAIEALTVTLKELRKDASPDVGMFRLPNGEALYTAMIRHMTDTNMDAETIHQLGLDEVARIHNEMDVLLKQIGMTEGTVGERMQVMLNDPQYLFEDSDEGRAALLASMRADLEKLNPLLPDWFQTVVTDEVDIKAIPKSREATGCGGCYDAPSKEAGTNGTFWINLKVIEASPSYGLQTLTYHETNPGHHFQVIIGLSDDLPIIGSMLYSNAAGEGWGLYAESLAAEMGIYEGDPVDDLGRLQAELHRAVRLVVDTGMHALGWSRQKAIDYSIQTEGIHISEATSEVDRYATWPGQALGYKIGQLKILELRERARTTLGEKFDVRVFHDKVLESGSIPLNMLEAKIDTWIDSFET